MRGRFVRLRRLPGADMAIHLITGVPGAGKSLRAVFQVTKRLGTEMEQDRPVFGNVRGFRRQSPLPGSRFQHPDGRFEEIPGTWMDCPDGSIIMIDEVQERWRRYRATGEPPPEIAALERHRHRNIAFVLTCQNPKQLSDDVRSLVDTHEHLTKKGKGVATVYRWSGRCSTTPYSSRRDPDCEVEPGRYPKWVFDEYVSAVSHTVRNKVPRIVKVAACMVVAIPLAFWFAWSRITTIGGAEAAEVAQGDAVTMTQGAVMPAVDPVEVEQLVPTAQAYGGIKDEKRCFLYNERGKRLSVTPTTCLNAFELGFPVTVELYETI